MKYRKEIDGLRAVAVLPVIFFHAGFNIFSGGYVGVDVFFVISGYLITTIILTEKEAGKFTITNFYERRARRILPALFFVILVSLPFAWEWMLPSQLKDFSQSLAAVSIFSSNILFTLESGYFAAAAELKPFLHTWSLAVEEQYYVLFPLLILITWRFGKKPIFAILVLIGLVSISLSQWGTLNAPSANFYLLPTRLWELLIGSLTAFYLLNQDTQQYSRLSFSLIANQVLSAFGLLLILYAIFVFDNQTPFPSYYALIPTVGTALIILFSSEYTFTGQFLSNRIFVGIGLISYSAYLWHQPIFAFARLRSINQPSSQLMVTLGILSLVLAYLTWKYVEKPFRNKANFNRKKIFQGASVLSVVVFGIGILGHTGNGFDTRTTVDGLIYSESNPEDRIRINMGLSKACIKAFTLSEECRTDEKPEIIVWGDSFAMHLMQGIIASKPDAKVIQMTKNLCGPIVGLAPTNKTYPLKWADGCIDFNNSVLAWLKNNTSVRYAVLSSLFSQYFGSSWKLKITDRVVPADQQVALEHLSSTLDLLLGMGIQPVIFAPPPSTGKNIGDCLMKAALFGGSSKQCDIGIDEYRNHRREVVQLLKQVEDKCLIVWVSDVICNDSTCSAELEGQFIYRDQGHLSHEGSAYVGRKMDFYRLITSG